MRVFVTSATLGILYEFNLPDRYQQGQQMGEAEAAALNRLMAENISRNRTSSIKRREEVQDDQILPLHTLKSIQDELVAYAEKYQIGPTTSERRGDIEREAEQVRGERDCEDCSGETMCVNCLSEGRRRVLVKAGIAQRALAEL